MFRFKLSRLLVALPLFGCGNNSPPFELASSRQLERDISSSCRAAEARAQAAAHPDISTIALHDRLQKKADELRAKALEKGVHGLELQAAAEQIAQAQMNADAVVDSKGKFLVALSCWASLRTAKETNLGMQKRLSEIASEGLNTNPTRAVHQPIVTLQRTAAAPNELPSAHPC